MSEEVVEVLEVVVEVPEVVGEEPEVVGGGPEVVVVLDEGGEERVVFWVFEMVLCLFKGFTACM